MASATAWLRGDPGPREKTTGAPKRTDTLARQAKGQRMCTDSVPPIGDRHHWHARVQREQSDGAARIAELG